VGNRVQANATGSASSSRIGNENQNFITGVPEPECWSPLGSLSPLVEPQHGHLHHSSMQAYFESHTPQDPSTAGIQHRHQRQHEEPPPNDVNSALFVQAPTPAESHPLEEELPSDDEAVPGAHEAARAELLKEITVTTVNLYKGTIACAKVRH
jgi:hypothetical protein